MMTRKKILNQLDNATAATSQDLIKAYQKEAKKILADAERLYLKLEAGGQLSVAELYRQDRYYQLLADINKKLQKLGSKEIVILNSGMNALYHASISSVNPLSLVDEKQVEQVINEVWCADGKRWSDRVWTHKAELQQTLADSLMECVIQGASHQKMIEELQHRFDVSRHQSETIARTELSRVQNKAAAQGYIDAGFDRYEFITALDGRTCGHCEELNGQIFYFSEAKEGVNFPPMHPNCRSNIVAYRGR